MCEKCEKCEILPKNLGFARFRFFIALLAHRLFISLSALAHRLARQSKCDKVRDDVRTLLAHSTK
jgi:hypothetical protein